MKKNPHMSPTGPDPDEEMLDIVEQEIRKMDKEEKEELDGQLQKLEETVWKFVNVEEHSHSNKPTWKYEKDSTTGLVPAQERRGVYLQDIGEKFDEALDNIQNDVIRLKIEKVSGGDPMSTQTMGSWKLANTISAIRHSDEMIDGGR